MPDALERHAMVRLVPAAWQALLAGQQDLAGFDTAGLALVAAWAERGWPLVVRRPTGTEAGVPLGLPLPPALGKRRLSFVAPPDAIRSVAPPPRLSEVMGVAPVAWQPLLRRLVALDPDTRAFGSLAWQHATGLAYLTPTSDIDLLWRLDGGAETLLAGLSALADEAPIRLDGECIGAGGAAVQWRELAEGTPEVMVKTMQGVSLMPRAAFLAEAGC